MTVNNSHGPHAGRGMVKQCSNIPRTVLGMSLAGHTRLRAGHRWEAVPWVKASAYTLYGLSPPWELEGGGIDASFRTSESGQMLFNRCARWPACAAVSEQCSALLGSSSSRNDAPSSW